MADHALGLQAQPSDGAHLTIEPATAAQDAALLEAGRKLFASSCDFFYAAQSITQLPDPIGTEIAFAGRSNVGKSSLLNALTGRKSLARMSQQPGRTRQLNFFRCEAAPLVLVDMPGYGYAQAPKEVKKDWQGMMFDYLRGRPNLRRVLLLLDARIELKAADHTVMTLLDRAAVAYQIVLTKADDTKPTALAAKQADIEKLYKKHPACLNTIITTSATTGLGIESLRASIAALVEQGG
jgi:GTP-binding protein